MPRHLSMDHTFNPNEFWEKLYSGAFDGRFEEELRKLSREQREQVAILMAQRLAGTGRRRANP